MLKNKIDIGQITSLYQPPPDGCYAGVVVDSIFKHRKLTIMKNIETILKSLNYQLLYLPSKSNENNGTYDDLLEMLEILPPKLPICTNSFLVIYVTRGNANGYNEDEELLNVPHYNSSPLNIRRLVEQFENEINRPSLQKTYIFIVVTDNSSSKKDSSESSSFVSFYTKANTNVMYVRTETSTTSCLDKILLMNADLRSIVSIILGELNSL